MKDIMVMLNEAQEDGGYPAWHIGSLVHGLKLQNWDEDDRDTADDWFAAISEKIGMEFPKNLKSAASKKQAAKWIAAAKSLGDKELVKMWKACGGLLTNKYAWCQNNY